MVKVKKKDNVDDLKKEIELDEHKLSIDQLCERYSTNIQTVNLVLSIVNKVSYKFFYNRV